MPFLFLKITSLLIITLFTLNSITYYVLFVKMEIVFDFEIRLSSLNDAVRNLNVTDRVRQQ
nr:hypothetical protein [Cronobacter dublinensis]